MTRASHLESSANGDTAFGTRILQLADRLAQWSETPTGLTCTYLSSAHRAVAAEIERLMQAAGLTTNIDAVGNVIGCYRSDDHNAKTVIIGSHYDTVTNAGKYDGRLGILSGLVVIEHLARSARRLPFHLELIAFSEEEGVRFLTSYIGSSAIAGRFDLRLLDRQDASGISLAKAIGDAGFDLSAIPALARRKGEVSAYLEVHIEQGPTLLDANLPVGVVTAIAGNSRFSVPIDGVAGHAGTVPMNLRHDAAAAAAEILLLVERRCSHGDLVGTVGQLQVPNGAINVIPARCELSLDVRSDSDAVRRAAVADILQEIQQIAIRRGVIIKVTQLLDCPAVPCSARLQDVFAAATGRLGIPEFRLPSGAGHDMVMLSELTEVAMLFVRCGNGGVSHSPLETVTARDADIGACVLLDALEHLSP